jgi:hypothetical protein
VALPHRRRPACRRQIRSLHRRPLHRRPQHRRSLHRGPLCRRSQSRPRRRLRPQLRSRRLQLRWMHRLRSRRLQLRWRPQAQPSTRCLLQSQLCRCLGGLPPGSLSIGRPLAEEVGAATGGMPRTRAEKEVGGAAAPRILLGGRRNGHGPPAAGRGPTRTKRTWCGGGAPVTKLGCIPRATSRQEQGVGHGARAGVSRFGLTRRGGPSDFCFKKSVIFVSWAAPGNSRDLSEYKRARSASLVVRAISASPGAAQISKMTGC